MSGCALSPRAAVEPMLAGRARSRRSAVVAHVGRLAPRAPQRSFPVSLSPSLCPLRQSSIVMLVYRTLVLGDRSP
eukprot:scaffold59869_cov26-Tisochrysis_lutea.AAC.1